MRTDVEFNRRLILLALEAIGEWDVRIEAMPTGPDRTFHESALRLAKGIVKARRTWLIETARGPCEMRSNRKQ